MKTPYIVLGLFGLWITLGIFRVLVGILPFMEMMHHVTDDDV